jgi:hypothetical protein
MRTIASANDFKKFFISLLSEFPQLLDITPEVDEGVEWYAVFVKGSNMVLHDSVMTLQAFGRGSTDAHRHPILLDVEGPDAIEIDEA